MATNVPVDYIMVGVKWKDDGLNGFLDEVNHILSMEHPPQTLSTSYGYPESSMSYNLTEFVISLACSYHSANTLQPYSKLCKAYAQLGARGVSVIYAAGDSGAGCAGGNSTAFSPFFPSNCP